MWLELNQHEIHDLIYFLKQSFLGGRGRMETEDKRRIRDMEETIRMKNKQIHQLLEDVEEVKTFPKE